MQADTETTFLEDLECLAVINERLVHPVPVGAILDSDFDSDAAELDRR